MRANKVDENQREIVEALRLRGHRVQPLNAVKDGCPDLLVGTAPRFGRTLLLLEVKAARNKRGELHHLTQAEAEWFSEWRDYPIRVVGSIEQAIDVCEGGWP